MTDGIEREELQKCLDQILLNLAFDIRLARADARIGGLKEAADIASATPPPTGRNAMWTEGWREGASVILQAIEDAAKKAGE